MAGRVSLSYVLSEKDPQDSTIYSRTLASVWNCLEASLYGLELNSVREITPQDSKMEDATINQIGVTGLPHQRPAVEGW